VRPRPDLLRRALAEALAAFALVFAGCGAIVADAEYGGGLGTVGIALVFGLVIMAMVYATGHLSGAHINSAVTVAFTLTRHFPAREALAYIAGQLAGATLASFAILSEGADGIAVETVRVDYPAEEVADEMRNVGLPGEPAVKLVEAR
jgi:glycerol uptake facilitator-like aquaporin